MLTQCWFDVGAPSSTLDQHQASIESTFAGCTCSAQQTPNAGLMLVYQPTNSRHRTNVGLINSTLVQCLVFAGRPRRRRLVDAESFGGLRTETLLSTRGHEHPSVVVIVKNNALSDYTNCRHLSSRLHQQPLTFHRHYMYLLLHARRTPHPILYLFVNTGVKIMS